MIPLTIFNSIFHGQTYQKGCKRWFEKKEKVFSDVEKRKKTRQKEHPNDDQINRKSQIVNKLCELIRFQKEEKVKDDEKERVQKV